MDSVDSSVKELSWNRLSDARDDVLKEADHFSVIDFSENNVSNLSISLCTFTNVVKLRLEKCDLRELPGGVYNLKKLQILIATYNSEILMLHSSIGQLSSLKVLNMGYCGLRSLPDSFWDLENLETLNLAGNDSLKEISPLIKKLSNLRDMDIGDRLNADLKLPDSFWHLTKLERLRLTAKNDPISRIHNLVSLIFVDIKEPSIKPEGEDNEDAAQLVLPESFWNLQNLQELTLSDNSSLKTLSEEVHQLNSLKVLCISRCELTSIPESLGYLPKLVGLNLAQNEQLKSLCSTIGRLKSLTTLDVSYCGLLSLPDSLWNLISLKVLKLAGNRKLEYISPNIGRLRSLNELDVSSCGLRNLPEDMENLHNLTKLNLSCNLLGDYPDCTLGLKKLEELDLSNSLSSDNRNKIRELPAEVATTQLCYLHLHHNPISVPPEVIWKNGLRAIKNYMKNVAQDGLLCPDAINICDFCDAESMMTLFSTMTSGDLQRTAESSYVNPVMRSSLVPYETVNNAKVPVNVFYGLPKYRAATSVIFSSGALTIVVYDFVDQVDHGKFVKNCFLTAMEWSPQIRLIIAVLQCDTKSDEKCMSLKNEMIACMKCIKEQLIKDIDDHLNETRISDAKKDYLRVLRSKICQAYVEVAVVSDRTPEKVLQQLGNLVFSKVEKPKRISCSRRSSMNAILKRVLNASLLPKEEVEKIYSQNDKSCTFLETDLANLVVRSQIILLDKDQKLVNARPVCLNTLGEYSIYSAHKILEVCSQVLNHHQVSTTVQHLNYPAFEHHVKEYKEGILCEKLLQTLLSYSLPFDVNDAILLLKCFYLIIEFNHNETDYRSGRHFLIPSILPENEEQVNNVEQQLRHYNNRVCVAIEYIGSVFPMAFFDASMSVMLSAANELGKSGVVSHLRRGRLMVLYDHVELAARCQKNVITLTAGSKQQHRNPWYLLIPLLSRLHESNSALWPGTPPKCVVMCPACLRKTKGDNSKSTGTFFLSLENLFKAEHDEGTRIVACNDIDSKALTCKECHKYVPQILGSPASKDKLTADQQNDIDAFYQELGSVRQNITAKTTTNAALSASTRLICRARISMNTTMKLQSRLRKLTPELTESLKKVNVHPVALKMWACKNLNDFELEDIKRCSSSFDAAVKLLDYTRARGYRSIVKLASALRDLDLPDLAEKVYPAAMGKVRRKALNPGNCVVTCRRANAGDALFERVVERRPKNRSGDEPSLKRRATSAPGCQENRNAAPSCELSRKLASARSRLVQELDASTIGCIIDQLISARGGGGLITDEERQLITAEPTSQQKARRLIDAVGRRGAEAIRILVDTLSASYCAMPALADLFK